MVRFAAEDPTNPLDSLRGLLAVLDSVRRSQACATPRTMAPGAVSPFCFLQIHTETERSYVNLTHAKENVQAPGVAHSDVSLRIAISR